MIIDGYTMHCLAQELGTQLLEANIDKISQLNSTLFIFKLRHANFKRQLIIDISPEHPAFYLSSNNFTAPTQAPNFCMFLRKHLTGAKIRKILCPNFERYIELHLLCRNQFYDQVELKLIVELMGKYSNLILVDANGIIKDCLNHVDVSRNRTRELMPLRPYQAPPNQLGKKSLLELGDHSQLANWLFPLEWQNENTSLQNYLISKLKGFSPRLIASLFEPLSISPKQSLSQLNLAKQQALLEQLNLLIEQLKHQSWPHQVSFVQELPVALTAYQQIKNANAINFNDFNLAFHNCRSKQQNDATFKQKWQNLLQIVDKNLAHQINKLEKYRLEIQQATDFCLDKVKADLILSNPHLTKDLKGQEPKSVSLPNYYAAALPDNLYSDLQLLLTAEQSALQLENLTVPDIDLIYNPQLNIAKNAQHYFKLYNKKKNRLQILKGLITTLEQDIDFLANFKINLLNAETITDLQELQAELSYLSDYYQNQAKNDLAHLNNANVVTKANHLKGLNKQLKNQHNQNQPGKPASSKRVQLAKKQLQAKNYQKLQAKLSANQKSKHKANTQPINSALAFKLSSEYTVLIGKNAKQNEYISLKLANKKDLWLHLQKAPGCHVLIKQTSPTTKSIPAKIIEQAASLCAWFSRSQTERQSLNPNLAATAKIDYCYAESVHKIPHGKLGQVYYKNYQTLITTPKSPASLGLSSANDLDTDSQDA